MNIRSIVHQCFLPATPWEAVGPGISVENILITGMHGTNVRSICQKSVILGKSSPDPFFVTEGIQTPSLNGSRAVRDWMIEQGFKLEYKEVNADMEVWYQLCYPMYLSFSSNAAI